MASYVTLSTLPRLRRGVTVAAALLRIRTGHSAPLAPGSPTPPRSRAPTTPSSTPISPPPRPASTTPAAAAGSHAPRHVRAKPHLMRAACSTSSRSGGSCRPTRSTAATTPRSRRASISVVSETESWTAQEPTRAEAWFYAGAAYGVRVQWRALRGERLAAARDGKRIKDVLERALALDPRPPGRVLRHRPLPLLRRRGPRGRQDAALDAAASRRRPRGGAAGDAAGAQRRPGAAERGRLPAAPGVPLVRKGHRAGAGAGARPARAASAQSSVRPGGGRHRGRAPVGLRGQPAHVDGAPGRRAGRAAWPGPSSPRCGRGWAWPASSIGCRRPTSRSSSCAAWWLPRPRLRSVRSPKRNCSSETRSIASGRTTRRGPPTRRPWRAHPPAIR